MPAWKNTVSQYTFFHKPLQQEVQSHGSHAGGMILAIVLVLAYSVNAVFVWATAPIVETYSAGDVRNFGILDLSFNISCPTCVPLESPELTNSVQEQFRVWHGYKPSDFPHCAAAGAAEDLAVVDEPVSVAALCYSSDDISERSGIVVSLWNMSTGGQGNRANVVVTGPSLVVNTPLEFWHEKTLLLGMNVFRDREDCTSADQCDLKRELYLGSMQYDGRVAGWPGAKLNIRLLRSAHIYTRTPGQTLWDVFGAVGGAYGLIVSMVSVLVHFFESHESKGKARISASMRNAPAHQPQRQARPVGADTAEPHDEPVGQPVPI